MSFSNFWKLEKDLNHHQQNKICLHAIYNLPKKTRAFVKLPLFGSFPLLKVLLIHLPVLVVLYILCQIHIQHNEVMHMAAGEWFLDLSTVCFTGPFPHPD